MEKIRTVTVKFPEHGKIVLVNKNGDTYSSKSEELIDFFFTGDSSESIEVIEFAEFTKDFKPMCDNELVKYWLCVPENGKTYTTQQLYNLYKSTK